MVDLVPDCCVRVLSRDLHGELQLASEPQTAERWGCFVSLVRSEPRSGEGVAGEGARWPRSLGGSLKGRLRRLAVATIRSLLRDQANVRSTEDPHSPRS